MTNQLEERTPLFGAVHMPGPWHGCNRGELARACSLVLRLTCSGMTLVGVVLLPTVLSQLRSSITIFDAAARQDLVGIGSNASIELVLRPGTCCGRGSEGRRGICLPGDPNGLCCAAEVTLLCGAGSICYLNAQGNPYCCAPRTTGCANVCLDFNSASRIIEHVGSCNPVSPQGFNLDGTVLYVDAPWNASSMTYQLDGGQNIMFVDPPIRFGAGVFTMTATITPRFDGRVGRIGTEGNINLGILFLRASIAPLTGFVVYFNPPISGSTTATVILARNADLATVPPGLFAPFNFTLPGVALTPTGFIQRTQIPPGVTVPPGVTIPPGVALIPGGTFAPAAFTIPPGFTLPPDFTLLPPGVTLPPDTGILPPGVTFPPRNTTPPSGSPVQIVTVNISGVWRANVPVTFRIIRDGLKISVFVNESRAEVVEEITQSLSEPVDVDADLEAPLFISPRDVDFVGERLDLDASIADMSMSSSADFP